MKKVPKFKNFNMETNEIKYHIDMKELGEIIKKLHLKIDISCKDEKEIEKNKVRRRFNFLKENGYIIKKTIGKEIRYKLSYSTRKIISFVLKFQNFKLSRLAENMNNPIEYIVYYLEFFIDMGVFPGLINEIDDLFILNKKNLDIRLKEEISQPQNHL